jgi:hypothetical protein
MWYDEKGGNETKQIERKVGNWMNEKGDRKEKTQ